MSRLVAAITPAGKPVALLAASEALSLVSACNSRSVLAYYEGFSSWHRVYSERPRIHDLLSVDVLMLVSGCNRLCSYSTYTLPSGNHAEIMACTLKPLGRAAMHTANPPEPQRRLMRAVLEAYIRRLLRDGDSLWRLISLMVTTGGAQGAVMGVLVNKPGRPPAPLVYAASSSKARLCLKYVEGGAAIVLVSWRDVEGYNCATDRVASLRPVKGFARVETKNLVDALQT